MKIIITGGCGFLGSNVAKYAIRSGHDVVLFDSLRRDGSVKNLQWLKTIGRLKFIHGDIRSCEEVSSLINNFKPQIIFHLSGQVAMTTSISSPKTDFEINALGTVNLLEAVRKYSPESITIYSSTNKVYGDLEYLTYEETDTRYICKEYPNGFDEKLSLDFHSPYGCSKGAADQYMLDYARIFGLKTVVFRHSSMYGGRQFATYDQGWIGWFCRKAIETKKGILKEPFAISGNGKQVRDALYVDDVVRLYFKTIENIERAKGLAFNIGGGMENSLSLLELFQILEKELGVNLNYIKLKPRISDQKIFVANIHKIRNLIGWKPEVEKVNGIKIMLDWLNNTNYGETIE